MFEKFTSDNLESFRQRYEGTYGFYKDETKKRMLVQLQEISATRCTFADSGGITYHLNPDSPREIGFEFLPPKSNWYNTPEGAMFCTRIAQRQYSRGVINKNLSIGLLTNEVLVPKRVDFASLSAVYENAISPADAYRKGVKGRSLAISSKFALGDASVYLLNTVIGKYKRQDRSPVFVFNLDEPQLWRTEINDAITAMGATAEIN